LGTYKTTYENMFPDYAGKKEISMHDAFYSAMFYQRPIKWELDSVGSCPFEPQEKRAAVAQKIYQNYRLAKNIANLKIRDYKNKREYSLSPKQINQLYSYIETNWEDASAESDKIPYEKIYKFLTLPEDCKFTIDRKAGTSEGIKCNTTLKTFLGLGIYEWPNITDKAQELVLEFLSNITKYSDIQDNENPAIKKFFTTLTKNIPANEKDLSSAFNFILLLKQKRVLLDKDFRLEQGRASCGHTALKRITEELLKGKEEKAIIEELYPAEDQPLRDSLRPYADIAKEESINDAVMAKSLREFKRTMDYAVHKFGRPEEIVIELSRDIKNSLKRRQYLEGENKKLRTERLKAIGELRDNNITASSKNIEKWLLWEEQNHKCPYSGKEINFVTAFDENKTQVDHIIPQAIGGPNIFANKVLVFADENKNKSDKVPYEYKFKEDIDACNEHCKNNKKLKKEEKETQKFGSHSPLINLVQNLWELYNKEKKGFYNQKNHKWDPSQKGKRILQKINNLLIKPENVKEEFAARQNQETAWIGKIVMNWCGDICPNITPSFGRLTAYLRGELGFDKVLPIIRIKEGKVLYDEDDNEIDRDKWIELFEKGRLNYKDSVALKEEFEKHILSLPTPPNNDDDKQKEFLEFCTDKRLDYKFYKRCDHRHHAVDAAVIGLCNRSMVQRASTHNAKHGTLYTIKNRNGEIEQKAFLADENIAPVYAPLKEQVQAYLTDYVVWHKPDHYPSGKFFDETAYNVKEKDGEKRFVIRQTLEKVLNKEKNKDKFIKKLEEVIVGEEIKKEVIRQLNERLNRGMSLEEAFIGNGEKGYLTFRKNRIKKLNVFYKEKYLIKYNEATDKQVDNIKYYQNAGYACMDFDKNTGRFIKAIPVWKYSTEKETPSDIVRIFANDIFFDRQTRQFFKVKKFAAAMKYLVGILTTEANGKEKFFGDSNDILLCKTRQNITKIKEEYGK